MSDADEPLPTRVALVGAGVIGAGWAARFLLNGIDVSLFDPDPDAPAKLGRTCDAARAAWGRLFPGLLPPEGTLTVAGTLAEAVQGAGFVQESLPEREELKCRVLAALDSLLPPDVVIASSTSGLLPTRLQAAMAHPQRLVVGHPFNPVYLLPLVELCGGRQTATATTERAASLYRRIGMQVLLVRKEVDGFIADRLLEAVWREGLWMIADGVATTAELDDAIRYGAGLRWAFMGTFLTYRLAGGEAGMRHFLAQFGPALQLPWTRLVAPELTDALADEIASQSDAQAAGASVRELERLRDDALVELTQALARVGSGGYGAGETLNAYRQQLANSASPVAADATPDQNAPLRLLRATVPPDWIDHNGHMTEHRYLQMFGDATDAVLRHVGIDAAYIEAGRSAYTVESHLRHLGQGRIGMTLSVDTQLLGADAKRIHLFHTLRDAATGTVLATAEQMLLHVDANAARTTPIEGVVRRNLDRLAERHRALPMPDGSGRRIEPPTTAPRP